jgi:hypothetical protein
MSSLARKQARELSRRMKGFSTPQAQAAIAAMHESINSQEARIRAQVTETVTRRIQEEYAPQVAGDLIMSILMFLRCKRGYGKKRLQDFLHEFNEFADDAMKNDLTSGIVKEILLEECGFDVDKEFEKCEAESNGRRSRKCQDEEKT